MLSLSKKLAAIRKKPRRVRERYLITAMLVIAPVLFIVWIVTFRFDPVDTEGGFFKSVGSSVMNAFNNPIYEDTFGDTAFNKKPETPAETPETATSTPVTEGETATSTPITTATSTPVTP